MTTGGPAGRPLSGGTGVADLLRAYAPCPTPFVASSLPLLCPPVSGTIHIHPDFEQLFADERCVADFLAIEGPIAKQRHGRRTLRFERGGRGFFIKCHEPVGWGEVLKNLWRGRRPMIGTIHEWRGIRRMHEIGAPTMRAVGCGHEGWPAAWQRSFLITEELPGIVSLEKIAEGAGPTLTDDLKRRLIRRMAQIAAKMHRNGVNHRDLYICHFVLQTDSAAAPWPAVYVIDLHRMQCRRRTPRRWIVKDLAAIYFSSMDLPPATRDLLRFVKHYSDRPLRQTLAEDKAFWRQVVRRAEASYRKEWGRAPSTAGAPPRPPQGRDG